MENKYITTNTKDIKTNNTSNINKMLSKKMCWLVLFLALLVIPIADGKLYKQYEDMVISEPVRVNQAISSTATCNITVKDPDKTVLVSFLEMTNNLTTQEHQYTIPGGEITKTGDYYYDITCVDAGENKTESFYDTVTPSGKEQTSILNNPMLLILGFLAIFLIILGAYFSSPWFGFIGAIMFLFGGIYTMIYGFNNVTDLYTRAIAITFIGLGFIFMFAAAYEWIWGGREESE